MNSVIPSILPSIFPSIEGSIVSASGTPSLLLDFARNAYTMGAIGSVPSDRTFASLITFSRASSGGRINAAGEFELVGNDVPRLTYDPATLQPLGLLVEEQRTNLLLQSSAVSTASWQKTAISALSSGTSPDGIPAEKITPVAGAGNHFYGQASAFTGAVDNGVFSISLRIKANGYNHFHIQGKTKSDLYPAANVDLSAGTITLLNSSGGATASISPLRDGWYLCSLSWSVLTGAQPLSMFLTPKPTDANSVSFTADGVSGALVAGHMTEAATSPSSYIPTEATQVTRAADVASVNALSPWYNAIEGTLVATCIPAQSTPVSQFLMGLTDGTSSNRVAAFYATPGGNPSAVASVLGSSVFASVTGKARATRLAMSYGGGFLKMAAGGSSVSTAALPSAPTVNRLTIGALNGSTSLNGIIQSITYYPRVIDVQQASA